VLNVVCWTLPKGERAAFDQDCGTEPSSAKSDLPFNHRRQLPGKPASDVEIRFGMLSNNGESRNSGGTGSGGSSRTLNSVPLLSTLARIPPPIWFGRLAAGEDIQLPPKLPYKLFRPPKFL
jgi:hypothetical protein